LNEDKFLNLIATRRLGNGEVDEKTKKKMEKEGDQEGSERNGETRTEDSQL